MLNIKDKIKSLPENERLFFDHMAVDQVNEAPKEFEDKLIKLGLVERDSEGDLSISFDVHITWTALCAEELEVIE